MESCYVCEDKCYVRRDDVGSDYGDDEFGDQMPRRKTRVCALKSTARLPLGCLVDGVVSKASGSIAVSDESEAARSYGSYGTAQERSCSHPSCKQSTDGVDNFKIALETVLKSSVNDVIVTVANAGADCAACVLAIGGVNEIGRDPMENRLSLSAACDRTTGGENRTAVVETSRVCSKMASMRRDVTRNPGDTGCPM